MNISGEKISAFNFAMVAARKKNWFHKMLKELPLEKLSPFFIAYLSVSVLVGTLGFKGYHRSTFSPRVSSFDLLFDFGACPAHGHSGFSSLKHAYSRIEI